jgi:hypothetical protein
MQRSRYGCAAQRKQHCQVKEATLLIASGGPPNTEAKTIKNEVP